MKSYRLDLNSISAIKEFCRITTSLTSEFDVESGRYKLDGKSIMGMFSLDLSKPIKVSIIEAKSGDIEAFEKAIEESTFIRRVD